MLTRTKAALLGCMLALAGATQAWAVPGLQLDITGASYVGGSEESVITNNKVFSLYALGTPTGNLTQTELVGTTKDTFYVAIALSGPNAPTVPGGNFGSFKVNGNTIQVTSGMVFGTPPLEANLTALKDAGDLAPHGIYPTYFTEIAFTFQSNKQVGTYNVQDTPGQDPSTKGGTGTYWKKFDIDLTGITGNFDFHFDLYDTNCRNGDIDVDHFAPFSHDAGYTRTTPPGGGNPIPEPVTLGLTSLGAAALLFRRNRKA